MPGDELPIGRFRGIQACASARGTFGLLALDHRQNLRKELRPGDPSSVTFDEMVEFKRAVAHELGSVATGILIDPEIAALAVFDGSAPADAGLLVAIEATGYEGPSTARVSRVLDGWSVAKAKRMGASAAKLLVYYHPGAENAAAQERLVATVAAECAAADLALFIEPLSFSIDARVPRLTGEDRRQVVIETARRLTALGGDVLKAEFPYDSSVTDQARWRIACDELDAASRLPWVLLSGGVDDATFEAEVRVACAAGASGVLAGRSVWAEAGTLATHERSTFLRTAALQRLARLTLMVDELAQPWHQHRGPLWHMAQPAEGWYRRYGG